MCLSDVPRWQIIYETQSKQSTHYIQFQPIYRILATWQPTTQLKRHVHRSWHKMGQLTWLLSGQDGVRPKRYLKSLLHLLAICWYNWQTMTVLIITHFDNKLTLYFYRKHKENSVFMKPLSLNYCTISYVTLGSMLQMYGWVRWVKQMF